MIKYLNIFWFVLRCLLVAKKENLTGVSTGLTTGRRISTRPVGRRDRFPFLDHPTVQFISLHILDATVKAQC